MSTPQPSIKLKKGEVLFNEGDTSKSMYFVHAGIIRLFKKKGNASIELGMIRSGEVIGEMGFLDGGPRSASAEALHDTALVEINNAQFVDLFKKLPPWLTVLLKTVVNRLRSANNKIRQLESASSGLTYGSEGVSSVYQFFSVYDVLKIASGLLLVASRNATKESDGSLKVSMNSLVKYVNQIMGIHQSKIEELLDVFENLSLVRVNRETLDKIDIFVRDIDLLDQYISFVNDQNLKDHTKKLNLSIKAVAVMGYLAKYAANFPPDKEGIAEINLQRILDDEKAANGGKDPFRMDDFGELVKSKLATEVAMRDAKTATSKLNISQITRLYRILRIMKEIDLINDKKREAAQKGGTRR